MKIIWITSLFPSGNDTTKGIYLYRTVKKLSEKYDITTVVVYPAMPPVIQMLEKPKQAKKIYKYWRKNFPKNPKPPDEIDPSKIFYIRYLRLPRRFFNHYEGYFAYFKAKKKFKKIITKHTIIHSNWIFPSGQLANILSKKYKVPYIVALLGTDVHNLKFGTSYWKKANEVLENAKIISSVSKQLFEKCEQEKIKIKASKAFLLDNIYDENKFAIKDKSTIRRKLEINTEIKIIFFAGGLVPVKNVQLLIKAFANISEKNKKVELVIAGAGTDKNMLIQLSKKLQCDSKIKYVGNLSEDSLIEYFNISNVFCLPSKSEGTPNVIVESLLCGVPVVASSVGGIPNVIKDGNNGYLFESNNVEELKEKLENALNTKWDRNMLRESVSHFFTSQTIKKYSEMYNKIAVKEIK